MRLIATAILTALLATPLPAAEPAKADAKPRKEKRICRKGEPTGSRLVVQTCRTEAEWAAIDREQAEHADHEIDRQQTMSRGGGSGFNPN